MVNAVQVEEHKGVLTYYVSRLVGRGMKNVTVADFETRGVKILIRRQQKFQCRIFVYHQNYDAMLSLTFSKKNFFDILADFNAKTFLRLS